MMRYLLDTNIFIFLIDKEFYRLSKQRLAIIDNTNNELLISEASLFEIAIKIRLGKPEFSRFNRIAIEKDRNFLNIKIKKSKILHYQNYVNIPQILKKDGKPHADPFDLLIISTGFTENLSILSTDGYFPSYTIYSYN